MASKEKVDIRRSEQFQEMDEALTRAMAELDSTIDRVSALFQADGNSGGPEDGDAPNAAEAPADSAPAEEPGVSTRDGVEVGEDAEGGGPQ